MGLPLFCLLQDDAGGSEGTCIAIVDGEGLLHGTPWGRFVDENTSNALSEDVWSGSEAAAADNFQEAQIPFFLARNKVMNEHRAMSGDGFMDCGTAGFADNQVMLGEQAGDAPGPAEDAYTTGVGLLEGPRSGI